MRETIYDTISKPALRQAFAQATRLRRTVEHRFVAQWQLGAGTIFLALCTSTGDQDYLS